ncbi:hypothetical protein OBBRIDRAFT_735238 [Obba rivulosa]|uniref:Sucrase/ferredoxin-like-domain-containing protein n=1 Tax=Obba rivulosa TaxID=1052685 RepID=A0A8E2AU21_9APHY|nr:hypothetical protein OBBRIDRAFT_735238 [Obba rivulosa]
MALLGSLVQISRRSYLCGNQLPRRVLWTTAFQESLAGTVAYHRSYILLHTHQPTSEYPSKFHSPLQRALLLKTARWGGVVNFSYSPDQPCHPGYSGLGDTQPEAYSATAFSACGRIELPEVSTANLDDVAETLQTHADTNSPSPAHAEERDSRTLHLYVCTHGARDCRCGDTGGAVYEALRSEVGYWWEASDMLGVTTSVNASAIGRYAANILVYPHGDWLGIVRPGDVPVVLDEILARHDVTKEYHASLSPLCPKFWRGRMGLAKDEQLALFSPTS